MELRQLVRNSQDRVIKGNLPKGHLNGVLVSIDILDSVSSMDSLYGILNYANVRTKFTHDKVEFLTTNIPLNAMIALSDIEYGSIGSLSRQFAFGGLQTAGASAGIIGTRGEQDESTDAEIVATQYSFMDGAFTFYLDFGSIYCEDGNEFEVELEFANVITNVFSGVSVYSVSKEILPFRFKKYDIDFDLNEDHKNIDQAWLFQETLDKDAAIVVQADSMQYDSDSNGFRAATQVFGEIENVDAGILSKLFETPYGIPEDVWIKITKNGSAPLQTSNSRLGILTVRNEYPLELSTTQTLDNLQKQLTVVSKFERNHRRQAMARVASGQMYSSADVRDMIVRLTGQFNTISKGDVPNKY